MKKRHILTLSLILTTFMACGQTQSKSVGAKKAIDFATINYIQIRNQNNQEDFVEILLFKLTSEQSKTFVDKWNNADSNGICNYFPKYWLDVLLKDGTKRTFRINGRNIKENNDMCFDLRDIKYIEQLWMERK